MKTLRVAMILSLLSLSMNLFSSVHEERMKLRKELFNERSIEKKQNEDARQYATSIKGLVYICLLLTPVSWKHVITVPYHLQLPIVDEESQAKKFIRTISKNKYN